MRESFPKFSLTMSDARKVKMREEHHAADHRYVTA
jgi:hypothetical protein